MKLVAVSPGAAKQYVVSCQEYVGLALLRACQMQSVKRAEPKPLKERGRQIEWIPGAASRWLRKADGEERKAECHLRALQARAAGDYREHGCRR